MLLGEPKKLTSSLLTSDYITSGYDPRNIKYLFHIGIFSLHTFPTITSSGTVISVRRFVLAPPPCCLSLFRLPAQAPGSGGSPKGRPDGRPQSLLTRPVAPAKVAISVNLTTLGRNAIFLDLVAPSGGRRPSKVSEFRDTTGAG